jgi:hypothetical protein
MSGDLNPSVGNNQQILSHDRLEQAGLARADASRKTQEILTYTSQKKNAIPRHMFCLS